MFEALNNVFGRRKLSATQTSTAGAGDPDGFEFLGETASERTTVHNSQAELMRLNDPAPPYPLHPLLMGGPNTSTTGSGIGVYSASNHQASSNSNTPIENVPLVLHPALKASTQVLGFWPEMNQHISQLENHKKTLELFYDFNLEHSVLTEVNQVSLIVN